MHPDCQLVASLPRLHLERTAAQSTGCNVARKNEIRLFRGDWQGSIRLFRGASSGPCYHSYCCKSTRYPMCDMCADVPQDGTRCSKDFYYALPKGNLFAAVQDIVVLIVWCHVFWMFCSSLASRRAPEIYLMCLSVYQRLSTSFWNSPDDVNVQVARMFPKVYSRVSWCLLSLFSLTRIEVHQCQTKAVTFSLCYPFFIGPHQQPSWVDVPLGMIEFISNRLEAP